MEQALPMEELANQRLNVLIYSYSLLIKNLMEEGVELDKVKRASDKEPANPNTTKYMGGRFVAANETPKNTTLNTTQITVPKTVVHTISLRRILFITGALRFILFFGPHPQEVLFPQGFC